MREPEAFQERSDLDSFNVSRSWLRVWSATVRHKWLVLATTVLTLGFVVVYIYVWPPIYKGEVYFQVEREEDTARDKFYSDWSPFRKDDIESETSLMISGVILEEVATELDLSYDDVYHSFMSWTQHLWRMSWPGKKYKEVKEYFFPPKKSKWDLTDAQLEKGKVLSDFKDGVSIGRLGQSYVGVLVVKASTPRATEMANKLFDIYLKRRLERHSAEANRAFETLSSETELCRAALEAKENEMVAFSQKHELLIDFEREKLEVKQWIDMRQSILDTQIAVATSEARLRELDRFLALEQPSVTGTRSYERSMVKRELELTRLRYETDLQDKLNRYTPESPEVTELKHDIESITKRIDATEDTVPVGHTDVLNASLESMRATRNEVFASLAGARASLAFKEKNEQELGARLKALPAVKQEFTLLARNIQLLQGKYADLNSRLVQANVSKTTVAATMPSLRVVEYARPTDAPDWPRTKLLILAGLGVGLLLGIGAAILRDLYLDEVRLEDLAEARGDGQFYARIHVGSNRRRFDLERTSTGRRPRSFARRNGSGNGRGNGSSPRSPREDSDT